MRRRLLNVLSVLSLILCLATVGLWVRSYFYMESWAVQSRAVGTAWGASRGQIMLERTHAVAPHWYTPWDGVSARRRSLPIDLSTLRPPAGLVTDFTALGFRYAVVRKPDESRRFFLVPFWAAAAALLALPARRAQLLVRKWRRVPPGFCPRCGYDLRATPDTCPECGAVTTSRC